MQRVLERELMDDEEQSLAYARADFSASNQLFVDEFIERAKDRVSTVVDIGCGPGDVVFRLARSAPHMQVTAIDGSAPMLKLAHDAAGDAALARRVWFVRGYVPGVPLRSHAFDAVLSKDLLHHLPDPLALWREIARLGRPGALVLVMDLIRPPAPQDARRIVQAVAGGEAAILQEDFYNSLCAAFTLDEVREQLATTALDLRAERVSDRHLLVAGAL